MRIILVGFMGSGKTAAGRELADRLRMPFTDLDVSIERLTGMSITDLFREKGESGFRDAEEKVLREILRLDRTVLATGGGTPCFRKNMRLIKRSGISFYLKQTPERLFASLRFGRGSRPLLAGKNDRELQDFIRQTLKTREPYYLQADFVIEDSKNAAGRMIQCLT